MRYMLALLLLGTASASMAADRQYWLGVHDFSVPDVNSHTYGVTGGISFDRQTASGRHLFGSLDLYADRDEDELDPDHIPFRWDLHLASDGELWRGTRTELDWMADIDTRMNTVSSVEREITAMPAVVARYRGEIFEPSLKAGAGWFFLEIDDDVPKTRGYERGDFRNSLFAYSVDAAVSMKIGSNCHLSGMAQHWSDGNEWLQNQYEASLRVGADHWMKGSEILLSADFFEYNLDFYTLPAAPPILPWNDDLLVRLMLKIAR